MLIPFHSCLAAADARLVGDPVDTLTGAVFDRKLEFRLAGPLELWWYRHYDSSKNHRRFALGWGHTHDFDRVLSFDVDGISYDAPVGRTFCFPVLSTDGDQIARHGFVLRRLSRRRYELYHHGEPAMEFEFHQTEQSARLKRLFQGSHQILFYYNAASRLERITDSTGRSINVVEEADGRLISLTLEKVRGKPELLLVGYNYDRHGNLISTINGSGHGYTFAYDEANRMVLRTGRMGFNFYFDYDGQGRCVRSIGDDRLYGITVNYKIPGRVTKVTKVDGGVWIYCFDRTGGLTQILDPLGGVQKFLRDETGRVTLEFDQNQNATRITYDAAGAPIAKIRALGYRISVPENPNAAEPLADRVAANPAEYEYGRLFDREEITLPHQAQVRVLPLSALAKRLVFVRAEQHGTSTEEQKFKVRPLGALWWPRPKLGRIFNEFGKLVQQRDEFGRMRHWSYDASGNVSQYVDFDGGKWSYDCGGWHFIRGLTNPLEAEVKFSYTSSEEVATCTDAGGTRSEYRYDFNDHLIEIKRHGAVRDSYERDAFGNLLAKHAGDGRELLRFEIGPGNLPIKRLLASGDEHTFQYDKSGRHLAAATKKDFVEFAYDRLGNRVLEKRNGKDVTHRYQGWGKPAESVLFGRFSVGYQWIDEHTLVISDPGGKSHRIRFHSHGLVERDFSNGTKETAQYDALGRCLFKCVQRGVGPVWTRRFHWSGEGELHRVEDSTFGEIRHEYDAAHRLSRRFIEGAVEHYGMDLGDNLVHQPGLSEVTLQEGNRLSAANGFSFNYNDRNHIGSRQNSDGAVRYSYDSRDQLIRVDTPKGAWEAEYDALGRRTRKIWAGQATEYYWNRDQLVAEVRSNGQMRLYVYADPLALTPHSFFDYDSFDASPKSCRRYLALTDQIGAPCLVEDERGDEVWSARIEPFGRAQVTLGAKIEFNFRFPGHYFDPELGLHYNRFRYYDPVLGRYLQSDPWGIAGGFNVYAYRSNPLLQVDVRGLGEENNKSGKPCKDDEEGTKPGGQPNADDEEPWNAAQAARDRAAELQETEDNPPTTTSCAVDTKTNTPYFGDSGEDPGDIHPVLQDRINALGTSQEDWDITNCAEFNAVNKALWGGASPDDLDVHTVRVEDGSDMPRCNNCQHTTAGTNVTSD